MNNEFRAGFVGIIGMPNAGKSTLTNHLTGEKLSIVSARPQTTRKRHQSIYNDDSAQIVFVDAPGTIRGEKGIKKFIGEEVDDVIENSDVLIAVISLDEKNPENVDKILDRVIESGKPWIGVINKTDILELERRINIIRMKMDIAKVPVHLWHHKKSQTAAKELIEDIKERLPVSEQPLFDPELLTTHSVRDLAQEYVREACFEFLHAEIPFSLAVQVVQFDESPRVPRILANIIAAKDAHKPIVIGKGAATLKRIGSKARRRIEALMGQKIYLELNVVVKPGWEQNKMMLKDLGYVHRSR